MSKDNKELKGFYLDVARYVFDYMCDSHKKAFVIHTRSEEEQNILHILLKECFYLPNGEKTNYVKLEMFELGVRSIYVEEQDAEDYESFVNSLYRYADKEDSMIEKDVQKRLFTESLRHGFKVLSQSNK